MEADSEVPNRGRARKPEVRHYRGPTRPPEARRARSRHRRRGRRGQPAALALLIGRFLIGAARTAVDLVLPRTCPGCHAPVPWCAACEATLTGRPRSVALPEAVLDRLAAAGLNAPSVHALARYTGPVRAAVIAGKERGRRDLPPRLGVALGDGLAALQDAAVLPADLWLIPAPTRPAAAQARGGDPVAAMARTAAAVLAAQGRRTGVAPCLHLARRARDSVGLDAAARAANLAAAIRFDARAGPPAGSHAVFLDDVLTSGATFAGSCRALAANGVILVGALVLAAVPELRPQHLARGAGSGAVTRCTPGAVVHDGPGRTVDS